MIAPALATGNDHAVDPAALPAPLLRPPAKADGGLALTFDDNYVDGWYSLRDVLKHYGAKATFFVGGANCGNADWTYTEAQINELKALQADGNEIGCHGLRHLNATEYLQNHTLMNYLHAEVLPAVNFWSSKGIKMVSFAYPYGAYTDLLNDVLLCYFGHLRTCDGSNSYYKFDGQRVIGASCIDNIMGAPVADVERELDEAKAANEVLVLNAHNVEDSAEHDYITPPSKIEALIRYARDHDMKFYTLSQLNPDGGTHTD